MPGLYALFSETERKEHTVQSFCSAFFICETPLHLACGKSFHLHLIGTRFESRLQHRLQSWRVLCIESDPLRSFWHSFFQTLRPLIRQFLLIHRTRYSSYIIRCQIQLTMIECRQITYNSSDLIYVINICVFGMAFYNKSYRATLTVVLISMSGPILHGIEFVFC
jgi:hypothetical protein